MKANSRANNFDSKPRRLLLVEATQYVGVEAALLAAFPAHSFHHQRRLCRSLPNRQPHLLFKRLQRQPQNQRERCQPRLKFLHSLRLSRPVQAQHLHFRRRHRAHLRLLPLERGLARSVELRLVQPSLHSRPLRALFDPNRVRLETIPQTLAPSALVVRLLALEARVSANTPSSMSLGSTLPLWRQ